MLTLSEIINATEAELNTAFADEILKREHAVVTDTRAKPDQKHIFLALCGERFDGHNFVDSAIQGGASAAVVNKSSSAFAQDSSKQALLGVDDTLSAYGQIASRHRKDYQRPLVAITGSCGKTTVKGMLASILSQEGKTLATEKNFNNEVGVPKTLLQLDTSHQFAVVEAGAAKLEDIRYLTDIISPTVSLVNNVQAAHVEGFGSEQAIANEKSEIYVSPSLQYAVINLDSPYLETFLSFIDANTHSLHIIGFSQSRLTAEKAIAGLGISFAIYGEKNERDNLGRMNISIHRLDAEANASVSNIQLGALGEHQLMNALAASGIALALDIAPEKIKKGLEAFTGEVHRMQPAMIGNNHVIVDDSYNANPASVRAAIDFLQNHQPSVLVLGDMAELGDAAAQYHREIGEYAAQKKINALFAVGKLSRSTCEAYGTSARWSAEKDELAFELASYLSENSNATVLVKGSRSARMETIVDALANTNQVVNQ